MSIIKMNKNKKRYNLILLKGFITSLIVSCMGFLLWWPYHIENNPYFRDKGFLKWFTSTGSLGMVIAAALLPIGVPLILRLWNKYKKYTFFAWFGLYLFIIFMAWASMCLSAIVDVNSWWQGRHQAVGLFPFLLPISLIGLPFMLSGGTHSNPRYFWIASIIAGSVYLIEIVIYAITVLLWQGHLSQWPILFFVGIPGYLSIILGIGLNRMKTEEKSNQSI
jgi:hypothetical protein